MRSVISIIIQRSSIMFYLDNYRDRLTMDLSDHSKHPTPKKEHGGSFEVTNTTKHPKSPSSSISAGSEVPYDSIWLWDAMGLCVNRVAIAA